MVHLGVTQGNFGVHRVVGLILLLSVSLAGLYQLAAQELSLRDTQALLQELGYDPGPIDGVMGPKTSAALKSFQHDSGLPATGRADGATLKALAAGKSTAPLTPADRKIEVKPLAPLPRAATPVPEADPPLAIPERNEVPEDEPDPSVQTVGQVKQAPAPAIENAASLDQTKVVQPPRREADGWVTWLAVGGTGLMVLWFLKLLRGRSLQSRPAGPLTRQRGNLTRLSDHDEGGEEPAVSLGPVDASASWSPPQQDLTSRRPTSPKRKDRDCWVPASESARAAGYDLGGMIYVGHQLRVQGGQGNENCLINPDLKVAKDDPDTGADMMPYWPSYSRIDPRSRLAYLQWLAGGRCDEGYGVGYAFLFFYGLERRILVERCRRAERAQLTSELHRLYGMYEHNGSFRRYASRLLEAIAILEGLDYQSDPTFENASNRIPFNTEVDIARKIKAGEPLDADWLLAWWWHHPESYPRTPAVRAFPEFRRLFQLLFLDRYPQGLHVRQPKRRMQHLYRAASDTFEVDLTPLLGDLPSLDTLRAPLNVAAAIAERCTDQLSTYSRFLGRNPKGRGSLEGHALLPDDLARLIPNPELDALKNWAREIIKNNGGLVPVEELIARLEGRSPEKVGRKALASTSEALARFDVGLAPDPRFALRAPKMGEPVVLFDMPGDAADLAEVSAHYPGALLAIMLGAFIAHADGEVSDAERLRLEREIDRLDALADTEAARLKANLAWAMQVPPSLSTLRRHLRGLSEEMRHQMGRLAIAVAGSDGRVDSAEVDALTKIYRALELKDDQVFADLNGMMSDAARQSSPAHRPHEPVIVRPATVVRQGYRIPQAEPETAQAAIAIALDRRKIDAIMADTAKVSHVLDDIFKQDEPEEPSFHEEEEREAAVSASILAELDSDHRPLVEELASRPSWSLEEFETLANHFGLMPGGALETVNEWAFTKWDEPLLDDDGDLLVSPVIIEALTQTGQEGRP